MTRAPDEPNRDAGRWTAVDGHFADLLAPPAAPGRRHPRVLRRSGVVALGLCCYRIADVVLR